MSVCIIGRSNSGKTTVLNELVNSYGYSQIITTTTRPPRPNEQNYKDYHFVTDKEFQEMIDNNLFIEWREYQTKNGIWRYGSKYIDYLGDKKVVILTPDGYEKIKNTIRFTSVFINVKDMILIKRALKRDYKHPMELIRRYFADKKDFKYVKDQVDCDLCGNNKTPKELAHIIYKMDEYYNKQ